MTEDRAHYRAMPECRFDDADGQHAYTIGGRPVKSVTGILDAALGAFQWGSEWHMERGTQIHKAAEIILRGRIPTVDPRIQGQCDAIRAFRDKEIVAAVEIERQVYSPRLMYAGTLDVIADTHTMGRCIIDWKSSGCPIRTAIQLAGYGLAWGEMTGERIKTGVMVTLGEDGRYKCHPVKLADFANQFRACLTVANIKNRL